MSTAFWPRRLSTVAAGVLLSACSAIIGIKDISPANEGDAALTDGATDDASSEVGADGPSSNDGGAEEGAIVDGGACDDADANDDLNCGRCGHSCLGGACSAGKCQPVALATGQGSVSGIAVSGTHVYFSSLSGSLIARVAKTGGAVEPLASAPYVDLPKRIAIDDSHVYWGNADVGDGAVLRCPLLGCSGAPENLATGSEITGIALGNGYVYWADRNAQEIRRRPLDGGPEELVAVPPDLPVAVAVVGPIAYWVSDFSGQVYRNNIQDGGVVSVGVAGTDGRDIVADGTYVYWAAAGATGGSGTITRTPRVGGGSFFVGAANGDPHSLAADDSNVFWTSWQRQSDGGITDGGVYSCSRDGCGAGAATLATGQDLPRGIAIDSEAIYFATNGTVSKVARP